MKVVADLKAGSFSSIRHAVVAFSQLCRPSAHLSTMTHFVGSSVLRSSAGRTLCNSAVSMVLTLVAFVADAVVVRVAVEARGVSDARRRALALVDVSKTERWKTDYYVDREQQLLSHCQGELERSVGTHRRTPCPSRPAARSRRGTRTGTRRTCSCSCACRRRSARGTRRCLTESRECQKKQ